MSNFSKPSSGYRYAPTRRGDTLQRVAFRELGDASNWAQLAWFNNLLPPYITDDEALAGPRVLLSGQSIKIPSATNESEPTVSTADNVLLTDCALTGGKLTVDESGDLTLVSGRDNLKQAINHRVRTDMGELIYHPGYGCKLQRRKGRKNNAVVVLLGRMDIQESLKQETRLKSINSITVTAEGDVLSVQANVTPISGDSVTVTAST